MEAAGAQAVREETDLFAQGLRLDRDIEDYCRTEQMRRLMKGAVAAGMPAAEHARYFAKRLHLADADGAEDWEYVEHEHDINADQERLLCHVRHDRGVLPARAGQGAARRIGPLDPLQLPGSPGNLRLDFSCTSDALPSRTSEDVQCWHVGVRHRLPDSGGAWEERDLGQVGQLVLLRAGWGQDPHLLGSAADGEFSAAYTAEMLFDAWDDPGSPIHKLGLGSDGDVLLLLTVELDPRWRGFGLGALLARKALEVLGMGCRVIAARVDDTESPGGRMARAVGFHSVGGSLAVLDGVQDGQDERRQQRMCHGNLLLALSNPGRSDQPPF
ncbi:hypothetical protein [Streptomyces sp. NPDC054765]